MEQEPYAHSWDLAICIEQDGERVWHWWGASMRSEEPIRKRLKRERKAWDSRLVGHTIVHARLHMQTGGMLFDVIEKKENERCPTPA